MHDLSIIAVSDSGTPAQVNQELAERQLRGLRNSARARLSVPEASKHALEAIVLPRLVDRLHSVCCPISTSPIG